MTVIRITDLNVDNSELSYLSDLSGIEVNTTRGGAFWLAVVGAAWLGYEIAKEVKSHL